VVTGFPVDVCSVYVEGKIEALRYKWIASEKAQRDLGPPAINHWIQNHWHEYLRARWLEHVQGKRYWMEFERNSFGVLEKQFPDPLLLDRIVDRLKAGQENLDVIQWALSWSVSVDRVIEILEAVDVNSCRLSCRFSESDS